MPADNQDMTNQTNGFEGLRLDAGIRTSKRKTDARSPQQQRDMIDACVDANGYRLMQVHDSGQDESGKTMDRATLRDVMRRVKAGETDGLVLALTDRLGRAPIEEAMTYVRELGQVGYLVLADAGGRPVDLSDPMAETNLVLQLQMARQYWLTTANRFKRSQIDAVAAGVWIGRPPLGYRRGPDRRLAVDPTVGPVITEAFALAAGEGLHAACRMLAVRLPGQRWRTSDARRVLSNRAYLGHVEYGSLPPHKHAHEALTTPGVFEAAQTEPRARRSDGDYVLSGIATCAECGAGLTGQLQGVKGRRYRRYRCSNPACRGGSSIGADALEGHVRDRLRPLLADSRFRVRFEIDGLADAERALAQAETERHDFATNLDFLRALGPEAAAANAKALTDAVEQARDRLQQVASRAARSRQLPAAGELEADAKLLAALRAIDCAIVVRRGRGAITDRVSLPGLDDVDDGAGILAA